MDVVGALSLLLIAVAALASLGGYVAGAVRHRDKRRARGYFVLGVVTGFVGAAVARRPIGRTVLTTMASRLVSAQRLNSPLTVAALQVRRSLSR